MRPVITLVCALASALAPMPAHAQRTSPTQEQLQELLDKKLAAPWLQQNGWQRDYAAAQAKAKGEEKLIFAYFTRSYSG